MAIMNLKQKIDNNPVELLKVYEHVAEKKGRCHQISRRKKNGL